MKIKVTGGKTEITYTKERDKKWSCETKEGKVTYYPSKRYTTDQIEYLLEIARENKYKITRIF